jgi:hypothetical protein
MAYGRHEHRDAPARPLVGDNLIVFGYCPGPAAARRITDKDWPTAPVRFSLQAADVYSGIDGTIGRRPRAARGFLETRPRPSCR